LNILKYTRKEPIVISGSFNISLPVNHIFRNRTLKKSAGIKYIIIINRDRNLCTSTRLRKPIKDIDNSIKKRKNSVENINNHN
jgi:hypothetical protein